jgi:hypothetical protein
MKKFIIVFLFLSLFINVDAKKNEPKYKIIANSYKQEDIDELYRVKNSLLIDYKSWVRGVDDVDQVLYDHQKEYAAKYVDGLFIIELGKHQGKELSGSLKVNYCESSEEIEHHSFIFDFFK